MSAHAIGHVHEPVQTLVNTLISFRRPRKAKRNARKSLLLRHKTSPTNGGGCSYMVVRGGI